MMLAILFAVSFFASIRSIRTQENLECPCDINKNEWCNGTICECQKGFYRPLGHNPCEPSSFYKTTTPNFSLANNNLTIRAIVIETVVGLILIGIVLFVLYRYRGDIRRWIRGDNSTSFALRQHDDSPSAIQLRTLSVSEKSPI